jgi:hypothetical protein
MSADPDVGAVAPDVTEPVATGAVVEDGEVEEKSTPAYEPPADIGKFPDDEPASGGREAVQPAAEPTRRPEPEYRQPAGPQPDPWGKAIDYSGEDVYAKGSKVVEDHIRERVGALANTVSAVVRDQADKIASLEKRLSELGSKPAAMPRAFVEREHANSVAFVNGKLKEFASDRAWADPKVRSYMENGARQLLKDAAVKGKKGDMSDYQFISDEGMLDGVFYTAKVRAGYKGGAVPGDVSSPAAQLEHVRSRGVQPADDDADITPEMRTAAKAAGVPISELKKQIRASQKWNKERA